MSIEIGSKWVKDDEVVEVLDFFVSGYTIKNNFKECLVILFLDEKEFSHTLTEHDFLEKYNPYDVVYEWEFVAQQPNGYRHFTNFMTEKEMEHFSFQHDCAYYQRLDFTKRERKQ